MSISDNIISITEFKNEQESYVNNVRSGQQTKSVWLDLKTVEDYITQIKADALSKEIPISGLRLYLTAKTDVDRPINIAMCPTYTDKNSEGNDEQVSFDPIYSTNKNPATLKNLEANPPTSTDSSILGRGVPCPPNCPKK